MNANTSRKLYLEQPDTSTQIHVAEFRDPTDDTPRSKALPLRVRVTFVTQTTQGDVIERFVFATATDTSVAFSHIDVTHPDGGYRDADATLDPRVLDALAKADRSLDVHAEAADGLLRSGGAPAYRELHDRAIEEEAEALADA